MDPRIEFFERLIQDPACRILEFGPLNRPIADKARYPNSYTCDIRSTEEVKKLYSGNDYLNATGIYVDPDTIVPVDYVAHGSYTETFAGEDRFDFVIASHVLEHVEDLIFTLRDIGNLLKAGGIFCVVYPDKRYCFDHFRTSASFRDAYRVFRNGTAENSAMVLDFFYSVIPENNPFVFWKNENLIEEHLPTADFRDAKEHYDRALKGEKMDDVHYWPFTDMDFLKFLYDCTRAGLLPFRCVDFRPCAQGDQQFMLALEYDPKVCEAPEGAEVLLRGWMKKALPDFYTSESAGRRETERQLRQELAEQRAREEALQENAGQQELQITELRQEKEALRQEQLQAAELQDQLLTEIKNLQQENARLAEAKDRLLADNEALRLDASQLTETRDRLLADNEALRLERSQLKEARNGLITEKQELGARLSAMTSMYESISSSRIWRLTSPLRKLLDRMKQSSVYRERNRPTHSLTKKRSLIVWILISILAVVSSILFFSSRWLTDVWHDLTPDELIFHLRTPLNGTNPEMVRYYLLHYAIIELLLPAILIVLLFLSRRRERVLGRFYGLIAAATILLSIAGITASVIHLENKLQASAYLRAQRQVSTFIEENYVDPGTVSLTFPEKKRNLIYIYLESMETTFADRESGGGFEQNCIPELTALALENECFSDGSGRLNGAEVLFGSTWTMGGMFAQTSGLPLKIGLSPNDMNLQGSFFPGIITLGDLLEERGYHNELLIGSDADFGGRGLYFAEHGSYLLFDYNYAGSHHYLPENYYVWWGYEDSKLFDFARERLTALSRDEEPFNLTLLTVDTHFEDGYVCSLCNNEFDGDQYANVFACSSRQVAEFVQWIQAQDFYENTAVVLCGDHLTMDRDFCARAQAEEFPRRVYTAVLNGAKKRPEGAPARNYNTFDLFPTTLSALGVQIQGDRLGLGVDLYGETPSLTERYDTVHCNDELQLRSEFMEGLNRIEVTEKLTRSLQDYSSIQLLSETENALSFRIQTNYDCSGIPDILGFEAEYWDNADPNAKHIHVPLTDPQSPEEPYRADIEIRDIPRRDLTIVENLLLSGGESVSLCSYHGSLITDDVYQYFAALDRSDYLVFVYAFDEASASLDEKLAGLLADLGAQQDLRGHFRASYALVANPGGEYGLIFEELSDDSVILESGEVDGLRFTIKSAGYELGTEASVELNGIVYPAIYRGLNVVVYDRAMGKVVSHMCFDTCDSALQAYSPGF